MKWLIYSIFASIIWGHALAIEFSVYNSGQGNCGFSECDNGNVFLIDCGSSEHSDAKRDRYPKIKEDALRKSIREQIDMARKENKEITIIISHRDADHYNWIAKIFNLYHLPEDDEADNFSRLPTKIIVGTGNKDLINLRGFSEDKRFDKRIFERFLQFMKGKNVSIEQWTKDEYKTHVFPKCGNSGERPEALVANATRGGRRDINGDSIVMRFSQGRCSTIFLGDATKKTTQAIIDSGKMPKGSTVVIASHHGASSHGSNNEAWIKAAEPHVVIFSSGKHGNHKHPRCSVIDSYVDTHISGEILEAVEPHVISCFSGPRFRDIRSTFGAFSTFNEGNIHLSFLPFKRSGAADVKPARFTVSTDKNPDIIHETQCFSHTGIPGSPSRDERKKADIGSPDSTRISSPVPGSGLKKSDNSHAVPRRARRRLDF